MDQKEKIWVKFLSIIGLIATLLPFVLNQLPNPTNIEELNIYAIIGTLVLFIIIIATLVFTIGIEDGKKYRWIIVSAIILLIVWQGLILLFDNYNEFQIWIAGLIFYIIQFFTTFPLILATRKYKIKNLKVRVLQVIIFLWVSLSAYQTILYIISEIYIHPSTIYLINNIYNIMGFAELIAFLVVFSILIAKPNYFVQDE